MPPIVSIHLKRFAIHPKTDRKGRPEMALVKVNTAVQFERTLDLRPYVTPDAAEASMPPTPRRSGSGSGGATPTAQSRTAAAPGTASSVHAQPTGGATCGEGGVNGVVNGASSGEGSGEGGGEGGVKPRESSLLYDLYAVLLHTGSLEKGHYFALIKDGVDGSWYRFDDERVTYLSSEQLDRELSRAYGGKGTTSAYMLLYREQATIEEEAPAVALRPSPTAAAPRAATRSTTRAAPAAAAGSAGPGAAEERSGGAGYYSAEETAVL